MRHEWCTRGALFDVVLEVVRVARHDDRHAVVEQQVFQPRELVIALAHIMTAREEGMPDDRHGGFPGCPRSTP